jgi:hypothetical protein
MWMRKSCPHCQKRVLLSASRCRRCGYPFPENRGPKPAGLAMGAGFPLFLMGTLILFAGGLPTALTAVAVGMLLVGVALFFDPR